jgi:acyl-CoA dehydrogenase
MIREPQAFEAFLAEIRSFVRDVAIPNEDRVEADDCIPEEIVEEMRKRGYFGWSIPEAYGGAGLTTEELALANLEISQCSVAFRARIGVNTGIGSESLIQDGSEALKRMWLPKLASGQATGALALTEPEAGSDAASLTTTAELQNDGSYVLNGHKRYITLAPIADVITVFARTSEARRKGDGITAFVIARGTPGLATSPSTPKMGQEGAPIGEVFLENCRVGAGSIIGNPGDGFRTMMKTLNKQRVNLAALSTGPAIRMLEEAVRYALERRQSGKPIAEFQLIQAMLADCKVEIEAARALILETARKRDLGVDVTMEVSICKYFATEMVCRVADRVVQIFGGQGYVKGRGIERFYRDVRAFRIYEGTSQIHQLNIARHLLRQAGAGSAGRH